LAASELHPLLVLVVLVVIVVPPYLAADFARWEFDGMDVSISGLRQDRAGDRVKVFRYWLLADIEASN